MSVTETPFDAAASVEVVVVEARSTLHTAEGQIASLVIRMVPRHTGRLQRTMRPRLFETEKGGELVVAAIGMEDGHPLNEIVRWVELGTAGAGAGRFKAKRAQALKTPWGPRARVKGQRPNPFVVRLREAGTRRVEALAVRGSETAARKAERAIV